MADEQHTPRGPSGPFELPSLFDSKGAFVPLSEADCDRLSIQACFAYDQVVQSWDDHREIETKIEATTKLLHATVKELREVEYQASTLPRPTHLDLCRQLAASNR